MQQLRQAPARILQKRQKNRKYQTFHISVTLADRNHLGLLHAQPDRVLNPPQPGLQWHKWLHYIIYIILWSRFEKTSNPKSSILWNILSVPAFDSSTLGMSPWINSMGSQAQCFSFAWDRDFPFIVFLHFYRLWGWIPDPAEMICCETWGRHGPQSSIVCLLFSTQEPFDVLSVLTNLSRHNTFPDSKCFDLRQKCPRKRILSLPKKPNTPAKKTKQSCEILPLFQSHIFWNVYF